MENRDNGSANRQQFATIPLHRYQDPENSSRVFELKMRRGGVWMDFIEFKGAGVTPNRVSCSIPAIYITQFASILMQIVNSRIESRKAGKDYPDFPPYSLEPQARDRDTGELRPISKFSIGTVEYKGINRIFVSGTQGDKEIKVILADPSYGEKLFNLSHPAVSMNGDIVDSPLIHFAESVVNYSRSGQITYAAAQFLKYGYGGGADFSGGDSGGSSSGGRSAITGGADDSEIPF